MNSPRFRNVRHRQLSRLRYSDRALRWLTAQSSRLGVSLQFLFNALVGGYDSTTVERSSAPVNTVAPVVSGVTTLGSELAVTTGTWTGVPTPTFAYEWRRGGVAIAGATAAVYTLVGADQTTLITCAVTATNYFTSASAVSNSVGPIT